MNPKISVITVCRNAAELIEATMLSVLNQKYDNIEYIIIDGASTDGTQDMVNKYSDRIAYFVSEPDKGIYDAMNKGLSLATGEWVNFMNAGDTFADDMVLADLFDGKVYGDEIKVIGGKTYDKFSDRIEERHDYPLHAIAYDMPFCHQSCFVKNSLGHQRVQFNLKYRIAADYAMLYDIFKKYGSASFLYVERFISIYERENSGCYLSIRKAKWEYLKIQSQSIDWHWCKEFLRWMLHRPPYIS